MTEAQFNQKRDDAISILRVMWMNAVGDRARRDELQNIAVLIKELQPLYVPVPRDMEFRYMMSDPEMAVKKLKRLEPILKDMYDLLIACRQAFDVMHNQHLHINQFTTSYALASQLHKTCAEYEGIV